MSPLLHRRWLFLGWALLVTASIALGWLAKHSIEEQEQLVRSELKSQLEREAASLSVELGAFTDGVLQELMRNLTELPPQNRLVSLSQLEQSEPFVSGSFLIQPNGAIRLPVTSALEAASLSKELAGLRSHFPNWPRDLKQPEKRAEALPSTTLHLAEAPIPARSLPQAQRRSQADEVVRNIADRQSVLNRKVASPAPELTMQEGRLGSTLAERSGDSLEADSFTAVPSPQKATQPLPRGWIEWPNQAPPRLVGWTELPGEPEIIALFLNMPLMQAQLAHLFPPIEETPLRVEVRDPTNRRFIGSDESAFEIDGDFRYALGSVLTGWSISFSLTPGWDQAATNVRTVGYWVLLGMVAAILLGGTVLLWQAERAQRDAQQKSNFVSTVSHELRTPLTGIQLYAGMLAEGRIRDPEKQQSYSRRILSESERLSRLVTNVLTFQKRNGPAQPTHQARGSDTHPLNLQEYLQSQTEHLRSLLLHAGLKLDVDAPAAKPIHVNIAPDSLGQVLSNLIDNSIQYAGSGTTVTLELHLDTLTQQAVLDLSDDGPGIPEPQRKRIFEPFYQSNRKLTDTTGGLGIGLSLSRQLIEEAGGSLKCLQPPAERTGAHFEIRLPARSS